MVTESSHQTFYTRQVQRLISRIYARSPCQDTLVDNAIQYFKEHEYQILNKVLTPEQEAQIKFNQTQRYNNLLTVCYDIIELSEGVSFSESNRKSAQLLGTIQLLSPTEGNKVTSSNELSKALYKAVLSLRLLDRLIIEGKIIEKNILKYVGGLSIKDFKNFASYDATQAQRFIKQVKVPLIMAALLQEIGNYHPKAQAIFNGCDGTDDPWRTLNTEERKAVLRINYRESINYITEGIGIPSFVGNTKAERERFYEEEKEKQNFIQQLLKLSNKPLNSIGNVLKVPQIYSSIILSTKASYNYKLLPKVFQVLNKNANLGVCSQDAVDGLYKITGTFPQGFGIVYMPLNEFLTKGGCYEYAIVNGLYPNDPDEPKCRIATRNLSFISFGHDFVVTQGMNLYFTETAKKLARLSKERLHEILELLCSDAEERKKLDLLPRCWHAKDYFSIKSHQKIWNNVTKS